MCMSTTSTVIARQPSKNVLRKTNLGNQSEELDTEIAL